MKFGKEKLYIEVIKPDEYCRISHIIAPSDFNTNYPNPDRVNRIAREIEEYLKYKKKYTGSDSI